jgi:hypothetical protein
LTQINVSPGQRANTSINGTARRAEDNEERATMPPIQLNFRHIPYSADLTAEVQRCVAHAQRQHPQLESCRVTIAAATEHRRPVKTFDVHIEYRLRQGNVSLTYRHTGEGPYTTVRQAFESGERVLSSWLDTHRAAA